MESGLRLRQWTRARDRIEIFLTREPEPDEALIVERAVHEMSKYLNGTLPPSSAPLLEALETWFKAEELRLNTLLAYNARLASEKARGSFPPSIDAEYRAWRDAEKAEYEPRYALFYAYAALAAAKVQEKTDG